MCVGSWAHSTISESKRNRDLLKKEGRSDRVEPPFRSNGPQNWNRKPNCMRRPRCASVAWRKDDDATHEGSPAELLAPVQSIATAPPGPAPLISSYWVWLKRLKFSQRKSIALVSPKAKRLNRPKSKFKRPGK